MIYFLGDNHGCFDHILSMVPEHFGEGDNLIFLGDIETPCPFEEAIYPLTKAGIGVWFIPGNHDTDKLKNWENLEASQHRNLSGKVVEIEGLQVAGLGGIFRSEIWHPNSSTKEKVYSHFSYAEYAKYMVSLSSVKKRLSKQDMLQMVSVPSKQWNSELLAHSKKGKLLKHKSSIFPDVYNQLAKESADILVTHEAPSCHKHGFNELDVLAQELGVLKVFHGHHHDCIDYSPAFTKLGFEVYGVGFRGITNLHGKKILNGQFDYLSK